MDEASPEIIAGFTQSHNPEMYKLTPIPDWVLEIVPAEEQGEASPLLYCEDLACEEVRITLNAIADTAVEAKNGNGGTVISYDLSLLDEDKFDSAFDGAQIIRDNPSLPQDIRLPAIDFLKSTRRWLETPQAEPETDIAGGDTPAKSSPKVEPKPEIDPKVSSALLLEIEEAKEQLAETNPELNPQDFIELCRVDGPPSLKGEEAYSEILMRLLNEPEKLTECLISYLNMKEWAEENNREDLSAHLEKRIAKMSSLMRLSYFEPHEFTPKIIGKLFGVVDPLSEHSKLQNTKKVGGSSKRYVGDVAISDSDPIEAHAAALASPIVQAVLINSLANVAIESPSDFIDKLYSVMDRGYRATSDSRLEFVGGIIAATLEKNKISTHLLSATSEKHPTPGGQEEKAFDIIALLRKFDYPSELICIPAHTKISPKEQSLMLLNPILPDYINPRVAARLGRNTKAAYAGKRQEFLMNRYKEFQEKLEAEKQHPTTLYGRIFGTISDIDIAIAAHRISLE